VLKKVLTSIATMTFVGLTSLPAAAQVSVQFNVPLPGLEIHVANNAPPAMRHEHKPSRPGSDYLWVQGFWHWHGSGWDWVPGRWDRPDVHGVRWVKTRYVREGGSYVYQPGHWSNQRLVEGDDYQSWKAEKHSNKGHNKHPNSQ
jgi:hypothetical protein